LPASALGPAFRRSLQGDLERGRLGLLLLLAHGLHPSQSGAGGFGASEAWRKFPILGLRQANLPRVQRPLRDCALAFPTGQLNWRLSRSRYTATITLG
jgi:hypothetical protein